MRWGKRLLTPEQKISFINQNETDQKNGLLLNKVVLKLGRYVSIYKKSCKQLLVFAIIQTLSINTPAQNRNQCSFLFQEYNSRSDTLARNKIFEKKGVKFQPANGVFVHQVLGLKVIGEIDKEIWHKRITENLANPDFSLEQLQESLLSESYQGFLWTVKHGLFVPENKSAIQVKLTFKKGAIFIDQYSRNKFLDFEAAIEKYSIAGIHDRANNFFKILSFQNLESLEIIDPENNVKFFIKF